MFTIVLAWINAKYDAGYEGLFILLGMIDLVLVISFADWLNK